MALLRPCLFHSFLSTFQKLFNFLVAAACTIIPERTTFSIQHILRDDYLPVALYVLSLLVLSLERRGVLLTGLVGLFKREPKFIYEVL